MMRIAPSGTLRLLRNSATTSSSVLQGILVCGALVFVVGRGTSECCISQPRINVLPQAAMETRDSWIDKEADVKPRSKPLVIYI